MPMKEFVEWARRRSSPRDLIPVAVGAWLLREGIESGNEMFVFISLYLFGLIPAWWADGKEPGPPSPPSPPGMPPRTPPQSGGTKE